MDDFIYVAMTGASEIDLATAINANNLANASTVGFKAMLAGVEEVNIVGDGIAEARAYAVVADRGIDFTPGPIITTGRDLDVAVDGNGWIAVQGADGFEAYTRAGDLRLDAVGMLKTNTGELVLGEGGPIAVPAHESLEIAPDGTITVLPVGQEANALTQVDRIRLVSAPPGEMTRGPDGLMRMADGSAALADPNVTLRSRSLENSNVNLVGSMVEMIELARAYELHVKLLGTAQTLDQSSQSLLSVS